MSNKLESLDSYVNGIISDSSNIDNGVQKFAETLYTCAFQVFGCVKRINSTHTTTRKYTSPWFTVDCEIARAELKRANKLFRKYRTHVLHETVVEKRKQYKITRHARFIYNRNKKMKLQVKFFQRRLT